MKTDELWTSESVPSQRARDRRELTESLMVRLHCQKPLAERTLDALWDNHLTRARWDCLQCCVNLGQQGLMRNIVERSQTFTPELFAPEVIFPTSCLSWTSCRISLSLSSCALSSFFMSSSRVAPFVAYLRAFSLN